MSRKQWNDEEINHLIKRSHELAKEVGEGRCVAPIQIIANELGRSYDSVKGKLKFLRRQGRNIPNFQAFLKMSAYDVKGLLLEEKENIIERENKKVLKSLLKEGSTQAYFLELLEGIIPKYEFKPPPYYIRKAEKKKGKDLDEEDIVLLISDIHGGMLVDKRSMGGIGEYNKEIFLLRYENLKKGVQRILDIEARNRPVKRIWIFYLGDMVEGHNIFSGQPYHLDMHATESLVYLSKLFAEFEIYLSHLVPEVWTVEVVGNHGVPGGKKAGDLPITMSFDWLFYKFKEIETKNYSNIVHKISETWYQLVEVQNHYFFLLHGEDIRSYLRVPYYGIDRAYGNYLDLLKVPFTYFILGHFHASAIIPGSGYSEKIINGCWPGGSSLVKKIQVASLPEQWIFGVHPRQGITFRYKLKLQNPEEIKSPELDIFRAESLIK